MKYRRLGRTDIEVSTVCLGCWALIGGFNWGPQDEQDSLAAIDAALDAGVNFLDTAPMYGDGRSEELLGRALRGRRDRVVLATKVGPHDLAGEKLAASCEASLKRLGTDHVDLLQVHWPPRDLAAAEVMAGLLKLREAGKVRAIGVSNYGEADLGIMLGAGRIESNQLAYSLLWRPIEYETQPICVREDVSILCYSPLAQGLLTGKFSRPGDVPDDRARTRLFSGKRPLARHGEAGCEAEVFEAIGLLRAMCAEQGLPMGTAALAWLLAQPAVCSVIAGARNAAQARENAAAGDVVLPASVVERLSEATAPVKQRIGRNADAWEGGQRTRIR